MKELVCSFEGTGVHSEKGKISSGEEFFLYKGIILDSSMVEHSAVNRVVVGSSPTRGAKEPRFL